MSCGTPSCSTVGHKALYADRISVNGVYLGYPDLALLAAARGVCAIVVSYEPNMTVANTEHLTSLNNRLSALTQGVWPPDDNQPDLASHKTWILGSCRATFEIAQQHDQNHFFALFSKQQIGNEFDQMATELREKLAKRIVSARKRVEACEDDSDDAWAASAMDHLNHLVNKSMCFEFMLAKGLLPIDVAADGNCLLYSLLTCAAGWKLNLQMATQNRAEEMRADTFNDNNEFCSFRDGAASFCRMDWCLV